MNLLTELSSVLTEADDLIALTDIADEKEILNHDYSNIMDQAEDYLYIRKWEASSVKFRKIGTLERLQLDEIRNVEMEQKKAACVLKVKKPEKAKGALE